MPGWRAWIVTILLTFVGVVAAAWVYVPDFRDGARILWEQERGSR